MQPPTLRREQLIFFKLFNMEFIIDKKFFCNFVLYFLFSSCAYSDNSAIINDSESETCVNPNVIVTDYGFASCNLVVNEINIEDPQKIGNKDFIEFIAFCDGNPTNISLQGYKIIGLTTGTENQKRPTIELEINTWNMKSNLNGMLTIGGPGITNADISNSSPFVKYRQKYTIPIKFSTIRLGKAFACHCYCVWEM